MSDLQCPCTALLLHPVERRRTEQIAEALRDRRVVRVFAPPGGRAEASAASAAQTLRVPVEMLDGLGEDPRAELEQVSDVYRGETVLAVCDLTRLGSAYAGAELVEVEIDADGWRPVVPPPASAGQG